MRHGTGPTTLSTLGEMSHHLLMEAWATPCKTRDIFIVLLWHLVTMHSLKLAWKSMPAPSAFQGRRTTLRHGVRRLWSAACFDAVEAEGAAQLEKAPIARGI